MTELAVWIDRLDTARRDLAAFESRILAGMPWPLAERFGTEPEASWGPPEVLAHVAEMLPFWRGELARIHAGSEDPTPFGRTADGPLRIGVIGRDRTLPPAELLRRIDASARDWAAHLGQLDEAQQARTGLHPTLGVIDLDRYLKTFVIGHLEDHVRQLGTILA